MNTVDDYRALTSEIAGTMGRVSAALSAAEQTHITRQRQVEDRLDAARTALAQARERALRAAEKVTRTDETAERVWCDVRAYVGRRVASRLPESPEPRPGVADANVEALLADAKDVLAKARRGEWSPDPVQYRALVAIVFGALVAATVFGLAKVVLSFGSEGDLFTNLLAQLAIFLSPFAGIPLIGWGMTRFRGQRADVATVGLTVLGGLVVSCVLTFLLH